MKHMQSKEVVFDVNDWNVKSVGYMINTSTKQCFITWQKGFESLKQAHSELFIHLNDIGCKHKLKPLKRRG